MQEKIEKAPVQVIYVNGYGAPQNPRDDGNYKKYLTPILEKIRSLGDIEIHLYLAGGLTNNPCFTEAETMRDWFLHNKLSENVSIVLLDQTNSLIDNVRAFNRKPVGGYSTEYPILFYCNYPSRFSMWYVVDAFFRHYQIVPIRFDQKSLGIVNFFKEIFFNFPLNMLSLRFSFIDEHVRKPIRDRHVQKSRMRFLNS